MSQVYTNGRNEYAQNYSKSYISIKPYNLEFYTYSMAVNAKFQSIGTLVLSAAGSATVCPANRVLHVTGKRLVPSINPMNVFPAGSPLATMTSPGKLLLSVYDPITFLTGFIDPTSTTFAKYDQNLPNSFDLGNQGSGTIPPLGGLGGVQVATKLYIGPASITSAGGDENDTNKSIGQVTVTGLSGGGAQTITTTAYNSTTSQVFLTAIAPPGGKNLYAYYTIPIGLPNSFTISTSGISVLNSQVNWMVVN